MTALDLCAWQRRCGLRTDKEAAAAVGLGVCAYRRQRSGQVRLSRQTEMLALRYEAERHLDPLRLAEMADTLNKLIRLRAGGSVRA